MAVRSTPIARNTGSVASNRRVFGLRWHFFTLGCSLAPADRSQFGQRLFDLPVALGHLHLIGPVQLVGLPQFEEVLVTPCSLQCPCDHRLIILAPLVAQCAASRAGSRSPSRMAVMIRMPVSPLIALTISVNFTFICSMAFCMCWMCMLARLISISR